MAHYYDEVQDSKLKIFKIKTKIFNKDFEFFSAPGIFSKKELDTGTKLLVESAIIKNNWKILDFGCGYGAVGISIAAKFPSCHVTMIDVNKRAVQLAQMNAEKYQLKTITIIQSNFFAKIDEKFDTILVNPPQVAGKEACFKIIENSKNYLNKNGLLQLVARHNKGGKTLSKKMEEVFGNVKDSAKKSGYRIYVSKLP